MLGGANSSTVALWLIVVLLFILVLGFFIIGLMIYSKQWAPGDLFRTIYPDWEKGNVVQNLPGTYMPQGQGTQ